MGAASYQPDPYRPTGRPCYIPIMTEPMDASAVETQWHAILSGVGQRRDRLQRIFDRLPSDPRCRACSAPFGKPFGPLIGLLGFGRMKTLPQLCNPCFSGMARHPGGAEIELSMLFADVRGSTALAERMPPAAYRALLDRFYATATSAVQGNGGIIDKFLGDGVMALFIPLMAGGGHAAAARQAGRAILSGAELPVGAGVHTGSAWVGFVGGSGDVQGFTAIGDAVNAAHRLGEQAAAGELLLSDATASAAALDTVALEHRELGLKGREQPMGVWSEPVPRVAPDPSAAT